MTKREREALREYVGAVCQFSESQVAPPLFSSRFGRFYQQEYPSMRIIVNNGEVTLAEEQTLAGVRLNAADDRLRALGMLP